MTERRDPSPTTRFTRSPRSTLHVPTAFPHAASLSEKIEHLLAIGGPVGFIPWVPATFASLFTAIAWYGLRAWATPLVVSAAALVLFVIGGRVGTTSERLLRSEDPRNVVIDEIAGQTLTFLFVRPENWRVVIAGFVAFRILDVVKPFPARRAERLPGGWGIMADDIVAGTYAALVLLLLRHYLHWF